MNIIDKTAEKIKEQIIAPHEVDQMERATSYTLSDAIREGSAVSDQAFTWSKGDNLCALSAGVCAARARGYL